VSYLNPADLFNVNDAANIIGFLRSLCGIGVFLSAQQLGCILSLLIGSMKLRAVMIL